MSAAKTNIGFTKIPDELMDSQAWRTAPLGVRCVVLEIWRRHNGNNNGKIPYSRRDAQADLGCGPHQAVRYLAEAQERGFIEAICRGTRTRKGDTRAATTWRLTMERYGRRDPTKEWASWAPPENPTTGAGAIPLPRRPVPERYQTGAGAIPLPPKPVPERHRYGSMTGAGAIPLLKKDSYQGDGQEVFSYQEDGLDRDSESKGRGHWL